MFITFTKNKQIAFYKIIKRIQNFDVCTIRVFSEFIGKLVFAASTIKYGHLYMNDLEY